MAALKASAGTVIFANTTDTFTLPIGRFRPAAASCYFSAAGHCIVTDANGNVVLEMSGAAGFTDWRDVHFFEQMVPFWTPIKCSTLSGGATLRLYA